MHDQKGRIETRMAGMEKDAKTTVEGMGKKG
jgi:hypothetical protein